MNPPIPEVGQPAPAISAPSQEGSPVSLRDFSGKDVVLYFYPKDDTPGCTKEACGFRDGWTQLKKLGVVVLGVSPDSPARHRKFIEKYHLPFTLLADEDKAIATAYGVWGEKMFMGRKYLGVLRTTFWIGKDGRIRRVWTGVKAEGHAEEVLAALKAG